MTLAQILKNVRFYLNSSFDCENIAAELWMQAWLRQKEKWDSIRVTSKTSFDPLLLDPPLSSEIIHNRCVDERRRKGKEQKFIALRPTPLDQESYNLVPVVDELLQNANLSRPQQKLIIERFYLGCSMKLIAEHLRLSEDETSRLLHLTLERLRAVARETKGSEK